MNRELDGLDTFLGKSDILVGLLPLTEGTRNIFDAKLFAKLKKGGALGGPVFINAGRGGSQVEADLIAALNNGTLKGASLDVFQAEPLPADHPLWSHPRVIVTPHNAAESAPAAIARYALSQMQAQRQGQRLEHVVHRARGY